MSLTRNVPRLFDLLRCVLMEPRWMDGERVKQLMIQTAAGMASSMQDSGHSYAKSSAASTLTPSSYVNEEMGGITFVRWINEWVQRIEGEGGAAALHELCSRLQEISQAMQQQGMMRVMVVGDSEALGALEQLLPAFLQGVGPEQPVGETQPLLTSFTPSLSHRTFFALPIQVNHASLVLPTVPHTHPHTAPLTVASKLLSSVFLHKEIRGEGRRLRGRVVTRRWPLLILLLPGPQLHGHGRRLPPLHRVGAGGAVRAVGCGGGPVVPVQLHRLPHRAQCQGPQSVSSPA